MHAQRKATPRGIKRRESSQTQIPTASLLHHQILLAYYSSGTSRDTLITAASPNTKCLPPTPLDTNCLPLAAADTHCLPPVAQETHCLPKTPANTHCLPPTPPDTHCLPLTHRNTPQIPQDTHSLPPTPPDTSLLPYFTSIYQLLASSTSSNSRYPLLTVQVAKQCIQGCAGSGYLDMLKTASCSRYTLLASCNSRHPLQRCWRQSVGMLSQIWRCKRQAACIWRCWRQEVCMWRWMRYSSRYLDLKVARFRNLSGKAVGI